MSTADVAADAKKDADVKIENESARGLRLIKELYVQRTPTIYTLEGTLYQKSGQTTIFD